MKRVVVFLILIIAVIGYLLPAFWVKIEFLGMSRDYDFGIYTPFKEEDSINRINFTERDINNAFSESMEIKEIGNRIIISVLLYVLALIFLVIALAVSFFIKQRGGIKIIFSSAALLLHIVSSRVLITVPDLIIVELNRILNNTLRFFAFFMSIPQDIVRIEPGSGYWVTLSAMALLVAVNIFFIREK